MKYSQQHIRPRRPRNDPRHSESAIRAHLNEYGASTATAIADSILRDRMTVYRCLLRMKKRGQAKSTLTRGTGNPHVWELVE